MTEEAVVAADRLIAGYHGHGDAAALADHSGVDGMRLLVGLEDSFTSNCGVLDRVDRKGDLVELRHLFDRFLEGRRAETEDAAFGQTLEFRHHLTSV